MSRKLNDGCKDYQNKIRQNTMDTVQNAINSLKDEGAIVTIGKLIELTGYARSTFSKKHVDDVLKKNKVCKYENKTIIAQEGNSYNLVKKLEKDLRRVNKIVTKLTQDLEKQKLKNIKLQADYIQKNEDYQLLLGKWHTLVKKAKLLDISILD